MQVVLKFLMPVLKVINLALETVHGHLPAALLTRKLPFQLVGLLLKLCPVPELLTRPGNFLSVLLGIRMEPAALWLQGGTHGVIFSVDRAALDVGFLVDSLALLLEVRFDAADTIPQSALDLPLRPELLAPLFDGQEPLLHARLGGLLLLQVLVFKRDRQLHPLCTATSTCCSWPANLSTPTTI